MVEHGGPGAFHAICVSSRLKGLNRSGGWPLVLSSGVSTARGPPVNRSRSSAKTASDHAIRALASVEDGPLPIGTVVAGKYEIVRKLAEGGLGIVVLAVHRDLNQEVAIKYMKPEALATSALVARFHREARLAASLHSEHVVRVFDVGRHRRAGPYMVMEYLEGSDLATVMTSGRLEVSTAVDYVLQACDALAEAHSHGIVHRDLKPENLFLARRGTRGTIVKVVDFGLSKVTVPAGQSGAFPRLTEQGERFGTPMFMSPEQLACSADVDARSDIWALGVVLFELLTAELPFEGLTAATLAANIFSATPRDLLRLRPDASPELQAVILRCLTKDPAGRYRDIEAFAADLVPHGPASAAERLEAIRRALRTGSVKPPRDEPASAAPARDSGTTKVVCLEARTGKPLLDLKGHTFGVQSMAVSPDGERIVTGSWDHTAKVWDARTGTLLLDLKGHAWIVTSVAFSPDGMRIVTGSADNTARMWDAATSTELFALKGHTGGVNSVAFSADGTRLVTGSQDKTARVRKNRCQIRMAWT